jgi:hypothetical protein
MAMTPAGKRWALWIALALATGYAALQVSGDGSRRAARPHAKSNDEGTPAYRVEPAASGIKQMLAELGHARLSDEVVGKPFASDSWATSAAPAARKPNEAAEPPPFGYAYGGRFEDSAGAHVYLMRGNDLIPVKRGDKLDGGYEVVGIEGGRIDLIWLPGKRKVTLELSSLVGPAAPGSPTASARGVGATVAALEQSQTGNTSNRSPASDGGQAALVGAVPFAGAVPAASSGQAAGVSPGTAVAASGGAALGSVPARSGVLGTLPANLPAIGTAPRGTGMTMLPTPTSPMPILPAPSGKLGN